MIQSLGAELSALAAGQQRMDALANDTANVNTTGYEAVDLAETTVGQIETRTSYAAAVAALHVQDEMWASLLEMRR